jgi:hypothetical protein
VKIQIKKLNLSKFSPEMRNGIKATSFLVFGMTFVFILMSIFSTRSKVEEAVVQDIPYSEPVAQVIENTYEIEPLEYTEPEDLVTLDVESTEVYTSESTGEVLGAGGGDCTPEFVYERQWSCYNGGTAPTACEEVKEEDENGFEVITAFCGNLYVEVRVKEGGITYPKAFMAGTDPDYGTKEQQTWAEEQVIAPCYDKTTGKIIPGTTCLNALGSGGDPYSSYERDPSVKLASPILADELWKLHEEGAKTEPTTKTFYKMQIASEDDDHGPFYIDTKKENDLANSPVVALNASTVGGIPQKSPLVAELDRNNGSECDFESKGATVEYLELPNSPGYIDTVNCRTSTTGPAEQDITMNIRSMVECWLAPDSPPCVYRLSEYILINSIWGTPFQCRDGQCPIQSYDYTLASLSSPGAPELQIEGLEDVGGAKYQTQYVTTPCLIEYKDHSKFGASWKDVQIKCLWAVPHTRKLESQRLQGAPGIYPDNDTWLKRALDEAAQDDHFGTIDPALHCGGI